MSENLIDENYIEKFLKNDNAEKISEKLQELSNRKNIYKEGSFANYL
jgi:hypothetical protein